MTLYRFRARAFNDTGNPETTGGYVDAYTKAEALTKASERTTISAQSLGLHDARVYDLKESRG